MAVRRAPEELLHPPAHQRHPRRAADEDDLVDLLAAEPGIGQRAAARLEGSGHRGSMRRSTSARVISVR